MDKIYEYFKKLNDENRINHAFLIGNVFFDDCKNIIQKVIEDFFFLEKIDIENNPDIFILRPEGSVVTKEQVKNLLKNLSITSQIHNKKIYIIPNCEKLSDSVCNALLKTIEEPEEGIIAILITSNLEHVINTIKSRCSIIYLNSNIKNECICSEFTKKFIQNIEKYGEKCIYKTSEIYVDIEDREYLKNVLKEMLIIYNNALNFLIYEEKTVNETIEIIKKSNTIEQISDKILVIDDFLSKLDYYLNKNLLIDKFLIELGRCKL